MPADLPGELQVEPLVVGRRALGRDLHLRAIDELEVAILHEQPAHDLFEVGLGDHRRAALVVLEDPDRRLALEDLQRVVVVARREQHLDELLGQPLGGRPVDRAVERDDAAERAQRVRAERAVVGLQGAVAERRAARVVVLDDDARGIAEVRDDLAHGVEVQEVVE